MGPVQNVYFYYSGSHPSWRCNKSPKMNTVQTIIRYPVTFRMQVQVLILDFMEEMELCTVSTSVYNDNIPSFLTLFSQLTDILE